MCMQSYAARTGGAVKQFLLLRGLLQGLLSLCKSAALTENLLCYAEPCNLHGVCQSNNTCFCGNAHSTCKPKDTTSGCETNTGSDNNK